MSQTKPKWQFSSLRTTSSDEEIAEEAKKLLITEDLNGEIRYDVEKIVNRWTGTIKDQIHFQKAIEHIGYYFQDIKLRGRIYDFAIQEDFYQWEITVHYMENPAKSAMVLVVKII